MAIKYMTTVNIAGYGAEKDKLGWEYADSLNSASNGDTVIIPDNVRFVSVALLITAGSGYVEATISKLADVLAGTGVWVVWDKGTITSSAQDSCIPVTALRQVNVSGTTKLQLRAQ